MHFLKFTSTTIIAVWAGAISASAATIELRPDLTPYLTSLKETYVPYTSPDSSAKDWHSINGGRPILVSGMIEKGDADKLSKLMGAEGGSIVFDSPGGNFLEGIKIGELFQENLSSSDPSLTGVFVLKGQECLSACALAFALAGDPRRDINNTRFVEDGALLGFHMGTLPADQAAQTANVKSIMDLTYSIVAAYAKLIKGGTNPPLLLEKALEHREADSFFYLRGGQRSLTMGFTPVTRSVTSKPIFSHALDMSAVDAMCRTLVMATPLPKSTITYNYLYFSGGDVALSELIKSKASQTLASKQGGLRRNMLCNLA